MPPSFPVSPRRACVPALLGALLLMAAVPARAQEQGGIDVGPAAFVPNAAPVLRAVRASGPITLDGNLDEPAWQQAARASNFMEFNPREGARPEVDTEALPYALRAPFLEGRRPLRWS